MRLTSFDPVTAATLRQNPSRSNLQHRTTRLMSSIFPEYSSNSFCTTKTSQLGNGVEWKYVSAKAIYITNERL